MPSAKIIVDTGAIYAMADRSDRWHEPVKRCLETRRDLLIVPVTVLPEACYLLQSHLGQKAEEHLIA